MRTIASAALGTAAGFALFAGASPASAETVIMPQPATTQTITTETTTRTERALPPRTARRQVVTTRTVTQRVVPAPTTEVDRSVAATTYPRPIYDEVAPAPTVTVPTVPQPVYHDVPPAPVPAPSVVATPTYSPPLYDEVVATRPATVIDNGSTVATPPYVYRYVYEPDRILVIDPATGDPIQSIPR
jgi:hypothetical protein